MTTQTTKRVSVGFTAGHQMTDCAERIAYRGDMVAYESRFVVRTTYFYDGESSLDFHGNWFDRDRAVRYANSCDGYWREADRAKARADRYCFTEVVEVEPYFYVPGFGPVS